MTVGSLLFPARSGAPVAKPLVRATADGIFSRDSMGISR
jgi:hypothetical protein